MEGGLVSPIICIYCALEATLNGDPYTPTVEKGSDHLARCHPDPVAAQARREELERLLDEKIRKDRQSCDRERDQIARMQQMVDDLVRTVDAARQAACEHGTLRERIERLEHLLCQQANEIRALRDRRDRGQ
jgi:hypothetical protein